MIRSFLDAHGYDPGPSQRPLTSGAISGILATIPAIPLLFLFDSLKVEADILGMSTIATLGIGWCAMAIAGAAYARFFGRAANSVHGGWLFGMSFGFAIWAAGAVLVLPLLTGGRAPAGGPAAGAALSLIVWGIAAGILVPFVHRPLHESIETAAKSVDVGPTAAVAKNGPIRQRQKPPG